MTPPEAPSTSIPVGEGVSAAAPLRLQTIRKRSDFLKAARAKRAVTPGFILQTHKRNDGDDTIRIGFTCSKKVGNAVARNRAKRRLREIARLVFPVGARPGTDYVLIGRVEVTAMRTFELMLADLRSALRKSR